MKPRDIELDETRIRDAIAPATLYFFNEMTSTNSFAVEAAQQGHLETPALILTPRQTHGRGRREARWESTAGNLTMTVALLVPHSLSAIANGLPFLALQVGFSAIQSVKKIEPNVSLKLKWPNDLLMGDQKAGGILIETVPTSGGTVLCVGVGMNVNESVELPTHQNWLTPISLCTVLKRSVDLNPLVIELCRGLIESIRLFPETNTSIGEIENVLWNRGERVVVMIGERVESGMLEGLTRQGAARIRGDDGTIREFFNGSMRRAGE